MVYLIIAIILFILSGYCIKILFTKFEYPDKKVLSFLLALTFITIAIICIQWFKIDYQNEIILYYQNGDYEIIENVDSSITYKIIPTDYD